MSVHGDETMTVTCLSLDYDGCFDQLLFTKDEMLARWVTNAFYDAHNVYLMVGSNRQSIFLDCYNAHKNKNGSALRQIALFAQSNGWIFDDMLLKDYVEARPTPSEIKSLQQLPQYYNADTVRLFKASLSVEQRMTLLQQDNRVFSKSKIILLLVQMYHLHEKHPNDVISYHFFDDEISKIKKLTTYFSSHVDIIPFNINLHIYHYNRSAKPKKSPVLQLVISAGDRSYKTLLHYLLCIKPYERHDCKELHRLFDSHCLKKTMTNIIEQYHRMRIQPHEMLDDLFHEMTPPQRIKCLKIFLGKENFAQYFIASYQAFAGSRYFEKVAESIVDEFSKGYLSERRQECGVFFSWMSRIKSNFVLELQSLSNTETEKLRRIAMHALVDSLHTSRRMRTQIVWQRLVGITHSELHENSRVYLSVPRF